MTIRAVLWDLGGVLLRREGFSRREELATRLGITRADLERLILRRPDQGVCEGERVSKKHLEAVCATLGLSADEMSAFRAAFWGDYRIDFNLVDYIYSLRPRFQTALLCNAWEDVRSFLTKKLQIADAFDHLIISAEVGLEKPDARIYHLALELLDVAPHESVFLDDSLRNVQAARDVGFHAIHFRKPEQALAELRMLI